MDCHACLSLQLDGIFAQVEIFRHSFDTLCFPSLEHLHHPKLTTFCAIILLTFTYYCSSCRAGHSSLTSRARPAPFVSSNKLFRFDLRTDTSIYNSCRVNDRSFIAYGITDNLGVFDFFTKSVSENGRNTSSPQSANELFFSSTHNNQPLFSSSLYNCRFFASLVLASAAVYSCGEVECTSPDI